MDNVLQTLVRNELIYQQALELGLDNNPEYRRKVSVAEAQLRAFKSQQIAAFHREHVRNKAVVTEAEARIAEDHKDLQGGKPFEKVAAKRFPALPKGMKVPWDLGYLYWFQIPPSWHGVVERLEPGQSSGIIKGPGGRFWLVRLVDKKVDPAVTFDTEKAKIVEILQSRKSEELHETMLGQMRTKSKIVFPK
jgi:hypothetical protein